MANTDQPNRGDDVNRPSPYLPPPTYLPTPREKIDMSQPEPAPSFVWEQDGVDQTLLDFKPQPETPLIQKDYSNHRLLKHIFKWVAILAAALLIGVLWDKFVIESPSTGGTSSGITSSVPTPAIAPAVVPTVAAPPPATVHKAITAREWAAIAKNPDAHAGEGVIVYGVVTQFDAATGTAGFRANVDGIVHPVQYGYADYETNTVLTGDVSKLADVVNNDTFTAQVTILSSITYDTQIGGSTTVPAVWVDSITVTGSVK